FKIMCTCDAVISGSVALHFLLSTNQTNWTPTDLDLYVPQANACQLVSLGICKFDVVISKRVMAAAPIFQFHTTVVMNFISPGRYFCAYPALTFCGLSMVNP
ncbi:hypothetical protein SCLCIDRAFT_89022, partial [Scleroderma citrinum Foug A]